MAYDDFQKRVQINIRERPTSSDLNAMQTRIYESVRGVQAIKLFGHEAQRRGRWLNAVVDATNRSLTTQKLGLGLQSTHLLLSALENVPDILADVRQALDQVASQ